MMQEAIDVVGINSRRVKILLQSLCSGCCLKQLRKESANRAGAKKQQGQSLALLL